MQRMGADPAQVRCVPPALCRDPAACYAAAAPLHAKDGDPPSFRQPARRRKATDKRKDPGLAAVGESRLMRRT
jgi:hypothetical protein